MAVMTFILGTLGTALSYCFGWGLTGTGVFLIISGFINFFSYFVQFNKWILFFSYFSPYFEINSLGETISIKL